MTARGYVLAERVLELREQRGLHDRHLERVVRRFRRQGGGEALATRLAMVVAAT